VRELPSKPRSRSPSPPPPPSMSGPNSLKDDSDLPPPPSYSTLKRLSTYRRSDRESKREQLERMVSTETVTVTQPDIERLNQTVTCAEPSSPCREAAKGAAGWQKFHGRSAGRSVSIQLTQEEAALAREKRNPDTNPPPLPPKPKHPNKISMIGLPNVDQFIVMDNTAIFQKASLTTSTTKLEVGEERLDHSHSRSDSGLSSLSSWTNGNSSGTKSGSSSVRSSSIVSDCSSKIEELLEDQTKNTTFLSQCSLKLENLVEQDETCEKKEMNENEEKPAEESCISESKNPAADEAETGVDDYDYDDVCQSSTVAGVQRQLETIKQQKEILIKDIVQNEELGLKLTRQLEEVMSPKEKEKYNTFLEELEKVVLLVLSIKVRLQKAEEELSCGNLTDWEKESRRYKRDKLVKQLNEAGELKRMSDRRMKNAEAIIEKHLNSDDLVSFKTYIERKEELLTAQRACEDSEKNILL